MKYSTLSNDTEISKICFGCEPIGGTDCGRVSIPEIKNAISVAVESGINFFDTADIYGLGLSEERLAQTLGTKRYDINIATKVGVAWENNGSERAITRRDSSSKYIINAVESSLKRLKLDALPILYSHWPDPSTPIEETFETFNKLIDQGKVKLIGCSNYSLEQLKAAIQYTSIELIQIPLNLISGELPLDLQLLCQEHSIKIVSYNTLANGILTGKFNNDSTFDKNDRRCRLEIFQGEKFSQALEIAEKASSTAKEIGLTTAQYSLKWALDRTCVASVIAGIKTPKQLTENISLFNPLKEQKNLNE